MGVSVGESWLDALVDVLFHVCVVDVAISPIILRLGNILGGDDPDILGTWKFIIICHWQETFTWYKFSSNTLKLMSVF